jgi:hypothetical protein
MVGNLVDSVIRDRIGVARVASTVAESPGPPRRGRLVTTAV